nr:nuclear transport factor 2 family protein [Mesorhizobium sp. LSHC424B00]
MSQTDESLITATIEGYVLAMSTGAEEGLRAAFHPRASIIGNFQGAVEWLSVDAYVGEVMGAGLPPNTSPNWTMAECRCLCRRGDGCGLAAEHQPQLDSRIARHYGRCSHCEG